MSGRFFAELRDRQGLAYSVGSARARTGPGPSFLVAYMGTAPANAEAAEAGVLARSSASASEQVDERELARAKAYLLGHARDGPADQRAPRLVPGVLRGDRRRLGFPRPLRPGAWRRSRRPTWRAAAQRYLTRPTIVVLQPPRPAR